MSRSVVRIIRASAVLPLLAVLALAVTSCSTPGFIANELAPGVHGLYFQATPDSTSDGATTRVPAILLLPGGSGYSDVYDRIAASLAAAGYDVVIADYYGGGDDWGGAGLDTIQEIERYFENAEAAFDYLLTREQVDPNRVGIVGFSYGGMLALNVAADRSGARAVVDLYGYLQMGPADDLEPGQFVPRLPPVCIIHGAEDRVVSIDRAEQLELLLGQFGVEHEYHVLSGAPHAFIYREEDAHYRNQAIDIALDFLDHHLGTEPD